MKTKSKNPNPQKKTDLFSHAVDPQSINRDDAVKIIDDYFDKLGNQIVGLLKESFPIKALVLKTADDQNLKFPDDIQESSQIEVGTGPVTVDDKPAEGKFVMPDGVTLRIEKGIVKEIIQPTTAEIAARIRQEMADMRAQLKNIIVRKPFKAKAKPTGKRIPFHQSSK